MMETPQSNQKPMTGIYYSLAFGSIFLIPLLLTMLAPASWGAVLLAISWLYLAAVLGFIIIWLFRQKWAGGLLLDLPSASWRFMRWLFALSIVMNLPDLFDPSRLGSDRARSIFLIALFSFPLIGKEEIRRDGIFIQGILIRWSRIDSWHWEEVKDNLFLKLVLNRQFKFLLPCDSKFNVQPSQKEELEAILRQHCANSQEFSSKVIS